MVVLTALIWTIASLWRKSRELLAVLALAMAPTPIYASTRSTGMELKIKSWLIFQKYIILFCFIATLQCFRMYFVSSALENTLGL
jgi:Na+/H+-dicarboxylate symporter